MNWRDELKRLGHEGDGAYVGLMSWFDEHPAEHLSTNRMGQLGLRYFVKGRREWSTYNQATLERKARDLREFRLLESYADRGYVYFHLPAGASSGKVRPEGKVRWVRYEPVLDERGRQVAMREVRV